MLGSGSDPMRPPVLLISPPVAPLATPSLGLALLQGCLAKAGIAATVRNLSLDFARRVGVGEYQFLAEGLPFTPDLAGDWVFAEAMNGAPGRPEDYFTQVLEGGHPDHRKPAALRLADPGQARQRLRVLRREAGGFIDHWAERIVAAGPRVVGLSTVFAQTAAALALARQVKGMDPSILVVLGGANAEGVMGEALFEAYPCLDVVVSGEGEQRLPPLVEAWLQGRPLPRLEGVQVRAALLGAGAAAAIGPVDLASLPTPDYTEWFEERREAGLDLAPRLLVETSRGCWWGQRSHCTFCGLNGRGLAFRSKPAPRILDEIRTLQHRHPGCGFGVADNILGQAAFTGLLPRLAAEPDPPRCFYEVKANLGLDQLRLLKAAGGYGLQPGIESLSDPVLRLMKKGLRALQAIQLLKQCRELGLEAGWNLLGGFPGEDPADYARMADLLPLLSHLQPPVLASRLRLDRFSPLQERAEAFGLTNLHAMPAYRHVFGLPQDLLDRLAYFLRFDYADGRDPEVYMAGLEAAVARWKAEPGSLLALDQGERILVFDGRACATAPLHALAGAEARLLSGAAVLSPLPRLRRRVGDGFEGALGALQEKRLLLVDDASALALPLGLEVPGSRPGLEATTGCRPPAPAGPRGSVGTDGSTRSFAGTPGRSRP